MDLRQASRFAASSDDGCVFSCAGRWLCVTGAGAGWVEAASTSGASLLKIKAFFARQRLVFAITIKVTAINEGYPRLNIGSPSPGALELHRAFSTLLLNGTAIVSRFNFWSSLVGVVNKKNEPLRYAAIFLRQIQVRRGGTSCTDIRFE
jgi:hypothetical protein